MDVLDTTGGEFSLRVYRLRQGGREWSILQFMLSRTGKIVAKEQIIAAISNWDGTTSDNAIEVHVSRLRS